MARRCDPPPFVRARLEFGGLALCWFIPSIGLTLLNKCCLAALSLVASRLDDRRWMFDDFVGGFSYPLTTTCLRVHVSNVSPDP